MNFNLANLKPEWKQIYNHFVVFVLLFVAIVAIDFLSDGEVDIADDIQHWFTEVAHLQAEPTTVAQHDILGGN